MANLIKLRRSAVPGAVPTISQLDLGELAINTYDGKLYLKKNNGVESIVEVGAPVLTTLTATTETLAANQATTIQLAAFSGYTIVNLEVDNAAWVRIYSSNQGMVDDQYRAQNVDPSYTSDVVLELIAAEQGSYNVIPGIYVVNSDEPTTDLMYIRVTNLGSFPSTITVTVTVVEIGV